MVAVTVTIEGGEHDTEGSSPLAEEDEEMVSQRLLREEKAPVVDCKDVSVRTTERAKRERVKSGETLFLLTGMKILSVAAQHC